MKTKILSLLFLIAAISFSCKKTPRVDNDQTAPVVKLFKVELIKEEVKVTELQDNGSLPINRNSDFFIFVKAEDPEGVLNLSGNPMVKCGSAGQFIDIGEAQFDVDLSPNDDSDVLVSRTIIFHIRGEQIFGACSDPANPADRVAIGGSARNYSNLLKAFHFTLLGN